MPVIPGVNESQVLNAGSPVPIASPEEARMEGNATAYLGQGMFALGDALDVAAKKEKHRKDTLSQQLALQQFREGSLQLFAKHQAAERSPDDPSGYNSVGDFTADAHDLQSTILAKNGLTGDAAAGFQALAGDNINDMGKELLAKRIAINEKENDAIRSEVIAKKSSFAGKHPEELPNLLNETETLIHNDPGQNPATIHADVREAKANLVYGAINDLKAQKKFAMAAITVEKYGALFDPKMKEKLVDDINTTRDRFVVAQTNEINLKEKRVEAQHKELQRKTIGLFTEQLAAAGPDEQRRAVIIDNMQLALLNETITPDAFRTTVDTKVFYRKQDADYDGNTMLKLSETEDYDTILHKIQIDRDSPVGKVSSGKAAEMINRINGLKEREQNDPTFKDAQRRAKQYLEDLKKDKMLEGMSETAIADHMAKVNTTIMKLFSWISKNPKGDPEAYAMALQHKHFGVNTSPLPLAEQDLNTNSPADIQLKMDSLTSKAAFDESRGNLTTEGRRLYQERMRALQQKKKILDDDAAYKKSREFNVNSLLAPVAAQGQGPLRGK